MARKQLVCLSFLIYLIAFSSLSIFSQKIHGFIFCKTNEEVINPDYLNTFDRGMQKNYERMDSFCQVLSRVMKMEYVRHVLIGKDFNLNGIETTLSNVKDIGSNDIVILYFSTHGFLSAKGNSLFPIVDIRNGNSISTYKIHNKLISLKPKFVLSLIDACSNYAELSPQDSFLINSIWKPGTQNIISNADISSVSNTNYLTLFKGCGQIISCAGQPGATTYATSEGSVFTTAFLSTFNQTVNHSDGVLSWGRIFDKTKGIVLKESSLPGLTPHYPEWEIASCFEYLDSNKIYFNPAIDTPGSSRSFSGTGMTVVSWKDKILNGKYRYEVQLSTDSDEPIDSVTYFLKYDMPKNIVTLRSNEYVDSLYDHSTLLPVIRYDIPILRGSNFNYRFFASESFTVKAKIYLKQQRFDESFVRLDIDTKVPFWAKPRNLFFLLFLLLLLILIGFRKKLYGYFQGFMSRNFTI